MDYEVLKTCAGPDISLKRGYIGPIDVPKLILTDLLNAGYIKPIKEEKSTTKLKGKEKA